MDQQSDDEGLSADSSLIGALAKGLHLDRWPGAADTILELGDLEVTRVLACRHGHFTFETTSRGQRSVGAVFSSARDARRYMVMDLCESYRFQRPMAPVVMKQLAAGCQLEDGPTGHRLAWPTGEATFYHRYEALTFSWVIDADPNTILGSYRHPNGEPLFDLGVPVDRWTPADTGARMRPTRVVEPRIEIPPPDDEGAADRAAIDAVLADLGWQRQAPSGAQVFAVGDRFMGRAVAYRQSQFVYESTVPPDHRSARCSFSTAAAARQWLVTDLGSILRTRTLMPKIQPNRLGPLCTLERTPTGWDLVWSEGRASFPLGIGHLLAMTFSWVAGAELAEIVASFRHRNGEPLFDLGQPSQPAAE